MDMGYQKGGKNQKASMMRFKPLQNGRKLTCRLEQTLA